MPTPNLPMSMSGVGNVAMISSSGKPAIGHEQPAAVAYSGDSDQHRYSSLINWNVSMEPIPVSTMAVLTPGSLERAPPRCFDF
ncbi:hypothetical protein LP414_22895 [Polaromonas sp. P1(28)-13]|nr:hypothetical protein LP414_22895 [Polaromonas sp. P1(28)-13]